MAMRQENLEQLFRSSSSQGYQVRSKARHEREEAVASRKYAVTWKRIREYVDEHLGDPSLSASSIASATFVSKRQLYRIFQSNRTTVSRWIRDRRLERCLRDLHHPAFAHRSVAEIAFSWGFIGASHFSRAFKERYGRCPTAVRQGFVDRKDNHESRYSHLIVDSPKIETWLPHHCDLPPAPGQKGRQHHRILLDGELMPAASRHVMCNWIDRAALNPNNLPSGLSHEAVTVISGMTREEYEDYVVRTTAVPAHSHPVNETLLLIGTDHQNPDDLGADIELCLGPEEESHIIHSTSAVFIPANLQHCPLRIWRLSRPILIITILDGPEYI